MYFICRMHIIQCVELQRSQMLIYNSIEKKIIPFGFGFSFDVIDALEDKKPHTYTHAIA